MSDQFENEDALVAGLVDVIGAGGEDVIVGPGDDCAVVRVEGSAFDWLLKSDPVIDGVHFDDTIAREHVGRKAVNRCLSDIAAMGGRPAWLLLGLVVPPGCSHESILRIYRSAVAAAGDAGADIVGGDTSKGVRLALHVTAIGKVPCGSAVLRSTCSPGEGIYVSGELGGSMRGRHHGFVPRIREGEWLRSTRTASAMMDISDGLAMDLFRLVNAANLGASVCAGHVPVSREATGMDDGVSPLEHALCDGEDYELLFTVKAEKEDGFLESWRSVFDVPCKRIGVITSRAGTIDWLDEKGTPLDIKLHPFRHL